MPEEPMEDVVEEELGDPVPTPSAKRNRSSRGSSGRGPGRPPGAKNKPKDTAEAVAEGAGDAAEALAEPLKSRRTSSEARRGGGVVWGLLGTGVQVGGQVGGAPGLVAAGWVMQAQQKEGGVMLAQRLLDSRWYPYLEKLGRGGAGNMVLLAPISVALYVQVPPMRPLLEPIIGGMLSKTVIEVPDQSGALVKIGLWEAIRQETAQQDALNAQAAAEAEAMQQAASPNGQPEGEFIVPDIDHPEPGVEHVRSKFNDLADAGQSPYPPEI